MLGAGQLLGSIAALVLLVFMPPADGPMRLIARSPDVPRVRIAIEAGARLLSAGREDDVAVRGSRRALLWPLLRAGILPIAARGAGCGPRGE